VSCSARQALLDYKAAHPSSALDAVIRIRNSNHAPGGNAHCAAADRAGRSRAGARNAEERGEKIGKILVDLDSSPTRIAERAFEHRRAAASLEPPPPLGDQAGVRFMRSAVPPLRWRDSRSHRMADPLDFETIAAGALTGLSSIRRWRRAEILDSIDRNYARRRRRNGLKRARNRDRTQHLRTCLERP